MNKVNKNKYKIATKKISFRIEKNKIDTLKKIHANLKNSEIFDLMISNFYNRIDKRKKFSQVEQKKYTGSAKSAKRKYKIETVKISIIVDDKKFELIKLHSNKNSTEMIDFLIDEKLKTIRQF